ncbi:nitrous oxide reductase accessory protein NosL [Halococcus thailandensis]|uniref:Lipoprotein involved in nitrous oxide reduction n=1 Tax=Halococcus thailandensis JCM 13552 TaxID=1227457 RepID=M0NHE7_9EURY|nr:nitrous oxide reductase accessory protein NosL [Halococcus thailandensis]EMA56060.1 lipoprotein involved in nitrous oxide reduction [Halococcus thailandensis JCM 13552]
MSQQLGDQIKYRRRRILLAGASVTLASITGCLGGGAVSEADTPAVAALAEDATCDVCGMTISQHPGSTAQIFYADHSPDGHANPARFDTTWEAYQYEFKHDDQGWEETAFYVTDYSSVDYSISTESSDTFISRHTKKGAFALVADVTYVVGSAVKGAMGKDLFAFTAQKDAETFQSDHGGDLTTHDEITPEVVADLST